MFTPLSLLWQLLNQFLLSPWGLILPMSLLIALVAIRQIQQTPAQIARFYAEQLETCGESDIPTLLKNLTQMGDASISGLVKGLTSNRESVFTACRDALQHEFDRWQESPQREQHFLVLSEAILQTSDQFSPAAQTEAMRLVDQIMQIRPAVDSSPESSAHRQQTIAYCERIRYQLESMRRRRIEPLDKDFAASTESVASLRRRVEQPALLASNGLPFVPTSARENREEMIAANAESYNSFSVPRADRLMAYQKTQQNRPAESYDNPRLSDGGDVPEMASFSSPSPFAAEIAQKFAQGITADDVVP
ncbi:MAG: hypothetical protein LBI05_04355, partial [Planctomycetaceae bacterium]|nr:hypothetical protein [Planctomycetaceae bacterium]